MNKSLWLHKEKKMSIEIDEKKDDSTVQRGM